MKQCDILIVRSPFEDFFASAHRQFPYSLFVLKSFFKSAGLQSFIADLSIGEKTVKAFPKAFNYLKPHYKDDRSFTSLYQRYRRFGLSDASIHAFWDFFIQKYTVPKIICISSPFTAYRSTVFSTIKIIQKYYSGTIIIGGIDVIINPEEYELHPSCIIYRYKDFSKLYSILAEHFDRVEKTSKKSVYALHECVNKVAKNNRNKKNAGILYNNQSIDAQNNAFPSMQLNHSELSIIRYFVGEHAYIDEVNASCEYETGSIIFTNGCPHSCSFCYHSAIKEKFYYKYATAIKNELILMYKAGFKSIVVEDDSFFYNHEKAAHILRMLIELRKKYEIRYFFYNGVNYHDISEHFLDLMDKANVKKITVALGSVDDIEKEYKRPADLNDFIKFQNICKLHMSKGFKNPSVEAFLIAGLRNQTVDTALQSIFYIFESDFTVGFSLYYPIKKSAESRFHDIDFTDDIFYRSSAMNHIFAHFSTLSQATLFRIARCLEFIKKNGITRNSLYNSLFDQGISLTDVKLYQKHSSDVSRFGITIAVLFFIIKEKIWYRVFKVKSHYCFERVPVDPDVFKKFHDYIASYFALKNPYFSIILPVYNRLDRLKNTLKSIEKQKQRNFELVIVNDAADKNITDFLDVYRFPEDIPVSIVKNSVNMGISAARNKGLEASRGNLIVYMDSDDIMDERKLEYCLKVFKENQLAGWLLHDEEWIRKGVAVNKPNSFIFSTLEEFMSKMSERCIIGVGCCIFEKEFLEAFRKKTGYIFNPHYYVSEDYDFFLQLTAFFYYTKVNEKLQKKIGGDTDSLSKLYRNTIKSIRNIIVGSLANNERFTKVFSISINILKRVK